MANTAPDSTASPTATSMLATVPSSGATTGISIFIASTVTMVSPVFTTCPTLASILNTFPAAPAFTWMLPAPADAAFGTAAGVLFGKLMCWATKGKVNPLIGSAGVSAVPMAARVSQKVGAEADPTNFLLMHAMGPNVAGVIGTAVAAGTFMAIFGVK